MAKTGTCALCGAKKLTIRKDGVIQNHYAKAAVREKTNQLYCMGSLGLSVEDIKHRLTQQNLMLLGASNDIGSNEQ